ncbi:hypothetical protein GCM10010472_52260 [Pseudonocardia halophobica]|uniref:Uncharacterized protein n=1 Tax=Pseudonocardia halophobica TaxID=29401 RepID=A0A9W6L1V2_9PSEU|nr:hypothetical protein [Pseudonocardia halophobica]GLL11362.1 hypothetical protein GCM10017577_25030 [Pseudonocardia halophobica]
MGIMPPAVRGDQTEANRALYAAVNTLPAAFAIPVGDILRSLAVADRLIERGPDPEVWGPTTVPPAEWADIQRRGLLAGVLDDYRTTLAHLDGPALRRAADTLTAPTS